MTNLSFDNDPEDPRTRTFSADDAEEPGKKPRRYELLKKIGEGGFGNVYIAMQNRPVRRQVAIKIAKIKSEKMAKEILARFKQERQALALMNHEHIAQIFDAGASKSGEPYFVMEYVDGIPISEFCDQHRYSLPQRLELLILVCQAVQHAHQKGVIHRDIKPSNILVAIQDGTATPKVIDFGLAKAIDQHNPLTEDSPQTQIGSAMGTYPYMSPEQACKDEKGVDTRTDVYSLGVVLYELLTGTTPFHYLKQNSSFGYDPIRIIREGEPPSPSEYLQSSKKAIEQVSKERDTDPQRLSKQVSGDLDCIVMAAIDKDRNCRYATTAELADDIKRFLHFEPIRKRPPSVSYKVRKFARKNRGFVATSTAFLLLLFAGLATSLFLWRVSETNRVASVKKQEQLEVAKDELVTANDAKNAQIEKGSAIALARGRDAWKEMRPDDAIANFVSALRMSPQNTAAARWLYHALSSHRSQNWNPPQFVIGGDAATEKAILSQDGLFAATQNRSNKTVDIWKVADRQRVIQAAEIRGGILEDLFASHDNFKILSFDKKTNQGMVWEIEPNRVQHVATIQGQVRESELNFSSNGRYLLSSLDRSILVDASNGQRRSFDGIKHLILSADDSIVIGSTGDKIIFLDPDSGSVKENMRELPRFVTASQSNEGTALPSDQGSPNPQGVSPASTATNTPVVAPNVGGSALPQGIKLPPGVPSLQGKVPQRSVATENPATKIPTDTSTIVSDRVGTLRVLPSRKRAVKIVDGKPVFTTPGALIRLINRESESLETIYELSDGQFEIRSYVENLGTHPSVGFGQINRDDLVSSDSQFDRDEDFIERSALGPLVVSTSGAHWNVSVLSPDQQRTPIREPENDLSIDSAIPSRHEVREPMQTGPTHYVTTTAPQCANCAAGGTPIAGGTGVQRTTFHGPENVSLMTTLMAKVSCSVGVDCSKDEWSISYFDGTSASNHWKKIGYPVIKATFDTSYPRVLLASRPLPNQVLQLFDFSKLQNDPPTLDFPLVEQPPNQSNSFFLNDSQFVASNLAKNAVALWPVNFPSIEARAQHLDWPLVVTGAPASDSAPDVQSQNNWLLKEIMDDDGVSRISKVLSLQVDQAATTSQNARLPVYSDSRHAHGGEVLYFVPSIDLTVPQSVTHNSTDHQNDLAARPPEVRLQLFDLQSFQPSLSLLVDFLQPGPNPGSIEKVVVTKTGEFLILEGKILDRQPGENSILLNAPGQVKYRSVMSIYHISTGQWLFESWPGRFAAFHPDGQKIVWIAESDGSAQIYDLANRNWLTTTFRAGSNSRIVAAAVDPSGDRLAVVDEDSSLTVWDLTSRIDQPVLKFPEAGSPDRKLVHPMIFDRSGHFIGIQVDAAGPYYLYASDCVDCRNAAEASSSSDRLRHRTRVVNIDSQQSFWIENTIATGKSYSVTLDNRGMNLTTVDSQDIEFGPLAFNSGQVFLSADETILVDATRPETRFSVSKQTKIQTWNTLEESPLAPTIELAPGSEVICCSFHENEILVLFRDSEFRLRTLEIPLRRGLFTAKGDVPEDVLDWAEAYAGRRVSDDGRVVSIKLAECQAALDSKGNTGGIWQGVVNWLDSPPMDRPIWPDLIKTQDVGMLAAQAKDNQPESPSQVVPKSSSEQPPLIPEDILDSKGRVIAGFELDGGYLWQHEGMPIAWTQTSKEYRPVFNLAEASRDETDIYLSDKIRNLEIKLPIGGGPALMRSTHDGTEEWSDWYSAKPIPIAIN